MCIRDRVYQALESVHGSIERLTEDDFLHIIEKHCQQGVDYQTIHAGLLIYPSQLLP